jgi:hypothetical protein
MTKTRIEQIHNRIERIKTELVAIDEMRPGSVSKQFKEPDLTRSEARRVLSAQLLTRREKSN